MAESIDFSLFLAQSAQNVVTEATASTEVSSDSATPVSAKGFFKDSSGIFLLLLPLVLILMFTSGGGNRRKQKEMQLMLKSLEKGDKVQSIGGIIGTVVHVKEGSIVVKIDENAKMEFASSAIQTVLEKKNPVAVVEKKSLFSSIKEKMASKKESKQEKDSDSSENSK